MPENIQDVNVSKILESIVNHPVEAGASVSNAFKFHGNELGLFLITMLFFLLIFVAIMLSIYFMRKLAKGSM